MDGSNDQRNRARSDNTQTIRVGDAPLSQRSEREFQRADRHSRTVRWLKIGLPTLATLIVAGALLATWLARTLPADVAFASTSIVDGRLVMQDPRMSGIDGNERPYSMIADRAIQALGGSGIDLEGVNANVSIDENTTATLKATKGRYETQANTLRLFDQISVETSSGIRLTLASADVSLADGQMTGTGPVDITTPSQRLEAGNVVVSQGGKAVSFRDRVKLTLLPNAPADSSPAPAPSQAPTPSQAIGAEPLSSEPSP